MRASHASRNVNGVFDRVHDDADDILHFFGGGGSGSGCGGLFVSLLILFLVLPLGLLFCWFGGSFSGGFSGFGGRVIRKFWAESQCFVVVLCQVLASARMNP